MTDAVADGIKKRCIGSGLNAMKQMLIISGSGRDRNRKLNDIIKVKFITQLPTHAPSFAFYCNLPQYIKEPYKRFVENKMRENFNFNGVPILIFFRQK
jgi:predicted GTPase